MSRERLQELLRKEGTRVEVLTSQRPPDNAKPGTSVHLPSEAGAYRTGVMWNMSRDVAALFRLKPVRFSQIPDLRGFGTQPLVSPANPRDGRRAILDKRRRICDP
jgi:hypothetical protein